MKRTLTLTLALAALLPLSAFAHQAWLQPSQTVIAGTDPWITVDAAVSNDLFSASAATNASPQDAAGGAPGL